MRLNEERYGEMIETARRLFDLKRMDAASRFYQLSDARDFCQRFCPAVNCRVVSVSTTPEYFDVLAEGLMDCGTFGPVNGKPDHSPWLGSDILGQSPKLCKPP